MKTAYSLKTLVWFARPQLAPLPYVWSVKPIAILLLTLLPTVISAQGTALLLKKKGKTIQRYYPGRPFSFYTTDNLPVQGQLDRIERDSLFMTYYQIVQVPTAFGTMRLDTAGRYSLNYSLANVGSLPRTKRKKGLGLLSGAMLLGGLGYTVVNIFNTTREGDPPFGKENIDNVLIGLGTAAAGFLLGRSGPDRYVLGPKYQLELVQ